MRRPIPWNPASARWIAASATPSSRATAIDASAFSTLWRHAMLSVIASAPSRPRCVTEKRVLMQEFDEGLAQTGEVAAVRGHVVGVDIGDHRDHRRETQEGGVSLVGLGDQIITGAEPRVGAGAVETTADHEGRIAPALGERARRQAGGGGLAV